VLTKLTGHEWFIFNTTISPDGKTLASASPRDTTARLWDIDPDSGTFGVQIGPPMQHGKVVDCVVFSPDGDTLIAGTINGNIYLWDLSLEPIPEEDPGQYMIGHYKEAEVIHHQFAHPLETLLLGHSGLIESLAFSPDGKILASAGGVTVGGGFGGETDGTIIVWNTDPTSSSFGQQIGESLKGHTAGVFGLSYDPNGGRLASASEDDTVRLWDVDPGSPNFGQQIGDPLQVEDPDPWEVAFSPDGSLLVATYPYKLIVWDVDPQSPNYGNPSKIIDTNRINGDGLAFSPNGKFLAYGSAGQWSMGAQIFEPMQLWNVDPESPEYGQLVLEFEGGHTNGIYRVKYHPNGKIVASAAGDDTIRLWNVDPESPEFGQTIGPPMFALGQDVYGLAFSPDGNFLASGTIEDGILQLWDTNPESPTFGQPLGVPLNQDEVLTISLVYSPDGKYFAVGDVYHRVHLWNVDPTDWIDYICERTGRNLTEDEWNLYLSWAGPYDSSYKTCPQWP
jgi:WD40 repeat protein